MQDTLERFVKAQEDAYFRALSEIRNGQKRSHWMWYIFPQIHGLGYSSTARYYAIQSRQEAECYLQHPVLGPRLEEICNALFGVETNDPAVVFGYTDAMKLRSSMTLFYTVSGKSIFKKILDKFFDGKQDGRTLSILKRVCKETAK